MTSVRNIARNAVAGLLALLGMCGDPTAQELADLRPLEGRVRKSLRAWLEIHGSTSAPVEEQIAAA